MVYYRKYRPQKIEELDSPFIREKLYKILSGSDLHAFLFTGPRGLGKTSTARIIAKVLNCEKKSKVQVQNQKLENEDIEPCNKCDQCISITNGSNLDVLEIDAASNRGIDEIRDLREKVKLSPVSAKKKVYIIDEVHMLTTEAFNALLKTLEEPPSHVVFILCTTEPHKIPETIFSRCFHIPFKKATTEELMRSFKRIAKDEKLSIEEEALSYITSLSEGSFRDGVKILEELVLISDGKKVTKEFVEEKYKTTNIQHFLSKLLEAFVKKDAKEGLLIVKELTENGIDMKYFIEQLISELHKLLLIKIGIENEESKDHKKDLKIEEIKNLVEILNKAYIDLKYAVLPQLPLEIGIIEWTVKKNAEVANENFPVHDAKKNIFSKTTINPTSANIENFVSSPHSDKSSSEDLWKNLIDHVKKYNHSIAGVLRGCSLKSFDDKELTIEAKYKFHKEKLEEIKALEVLENSAEEITGNKIKILIELKQ